MSWAACFWNIVVLLLLGAYFVIESHARLSDFPLGLLLSKDQMNHCFTCFLAIFTNNLPTTKI